MELVNRYIAAVQRELPETKRDEIGRELSANIMDELDALREQKGLLADTDIAAVLKQMGHPRAVAEQFVPPEPFISPSYMRLYKHTLFMVLGILFLLQVVGSTSLWLSSQMGLVGYLHSLASGFLQDAMLAFSSITIAFWLMSRSAKPRNACQQDWQPEQLPKAGPGWQHISLQDIFTDLATYVFLLIVIWYPLWLTAEQLEHSRLMLSGAAHQLLQWASPLVLLGIANSLWQLKLRLWTKPMLIANVLLNTAFGLITLLLATREPLLALEPGAWQNVFEAQQLEWAAVSGLVVVALFPLVEALRDLRRLWISRL